ncbi:MAG: hypothetical protein ACO3P6_05110, partial [Pelagibacteraceae bacterium]
MATAKLNNNSFVGEAYSRQLFNAPSIIDLARSRNIQQDESEEDMLSEVDVANFDVDAILDDDQTESDTDNLPQRYKNKMRRYKEHKMKKPWEATCPSTFQYNNTMSHQATAYAELLKICSKHNCGKGLYNDIVTWAQYHAKKDPKVFLVQSKGQIWRRTKLLNHMKEVFHLQGLEPRTDVVTLHDGRNVTVPSVDFPESMRSILNDKNVMKHVLSGLHPDTWRPLLTAQQHEADEEAFINDKDSGWLYRQGIELHCPDETECDPLLVRPLPVILHIDKSHSDLFGNLAVSPIQCMPAMLDVNIQQYSNAWRQIATIPNLSAGKG